MNTKIIKKNKEILLSFKYIAQSENNYINFLFKFSDKVLESKSMHLSINNHRELITSSLKL